jgi:hypothetical protein
MPYRLAQTLSSLCTDLANRAFFVTAIVRIGRGVVDMLQP